MESDDLKTDNPGKHEVEMLTTRQLVQHLKERNLKSTGTKNALVNRLYDNWLPTVTGKNPDFHKSKPQYCCVPLCNTNSEVARKEGVTMHRIPSGQEKKAQRQQWLRRLRNVRANLVLSDNTRVCKRHFNAECFDENGRLKADSVPTVFPSKSMPKQPPKRRELVRSRANIPPEEPEQKRPRAVQSPSSTESSQQSLMRSNANILPGETEQKRPQVIKSPLSMEPAQLEIIDDQNTDSLTASHSLTSSVAVQTPILPCNCSCHNVQTRSVAVGSTANLPDVNILFDLRFNDSRTRFFTGFSNFATFMLMLTTLVRHGSDRLGHSLLNYWGDRSLSQKKYHAGKSKPGPKRALDMATEFLLTMIWYRLGLVQEHLAFMFKVSVPTISRTLVTWTQFIYEHSVSLVYLPTREEILMNMPMHFINHCNTYRVDDCTEFFLEKPSGLEAQCVTWSEYKHHNTIKCLVAVSPDGQVIYISSAWGGRASDRHIVDKEYAFAGTPEGMAIMADKGFEVEDLVPDGVDVVLPPKVSSKSQMSDFEFFSTVDVAEPRIVVEMKMEQAKNYKILQHIFPISRIATAEQVIHNCFAFTNLLPPLFVTGSGSDSKPALPIYM